ncbi:MAG: hypothetical protein GXP27_04340 [Planctomycetes bacterium]|nr:hypothetical protein [Planctomycetota bacterium]
MTELWVRRKIAELKEKAEWSPWADILKEALDNGKLRGRTFKTPWANEELQTFGETVVIDHGVYSP